MEASEAASANFLSCLARGWRKRSRLSLPVFGLSYVVTSWGAGADALSALMLAFVIELFPSWGLLRFRPMDDGRSICSAHSRHRVAFPFPLVGTRSGSGSRSPHRRTRRGDCGDVRPAGRLLRERPAAAAFCGFAFARELGRCSPAVRRRSWQRRCWLVGKLVAGRLLRAFLAACTAFSIWSGPETMRKASRSTTPWMALQCGRRRCRRGPRPGQVMRSSCASAVALGDGAAAADAASGRCRPSFDDPRRRLRGRRRPFIDPDFAKEVTDFLSRE